MCRLTHVYGKARAITLPRCAQERKEVIKSFLIIKTAVLHTYISYIGCLMEAYYITVVIFMISMFNLGVEVSSRADR